MTAENVKISIVTLIFIVATFVFGLIYMFVGRQNSKYVQKNFGWKGFCVFGAIGVPFHEMSHLITALLFLHKIEEVKLFRPKEGKRDGCLGFVKHSYRGTVYRTAGNVIIGAAPMIFGAGAIYAVIRLFFPETFVDVVGLVNNGENLQNITTISLNALKSFVSLSHFATWQFYLCLMVIVFIGCHMNMSWADVKGSWAGVTALMIGSFTIPWYLAAHLIVSLDAILAFLVTFTIQYIYLLSMILIIDIIMALVFFLIACVRGKQ